MTESVCHRADNFDPGGFDYDRVAGPAQLDLALLDALARPRSAAGGGDPGGGQVGRPPATTTVGTAVRARPMAGPGVRTAAFSTTSSSSATAHLITGVDHFRDAVLSGVDYLFGRNALGQSYVTGYGPGRQPPSPDAGCSVMIMIRASRSHRAGRSQAGPTRCRIPASTAIRGWSACRLSAAIWTSRRQRSPTTSASAGTPRWCGLRSSSRASGRPGPMLFCDRASTTTIRRTRT